MRVDEDPDSTPTLVWREFMPSSAAILRLEFEFSGSDVSGDNVTIEARENVNLLDSKNTADVAQGDGQGGNVAIDPIFVVLNGSAITARAAEGRGGVIDIDTQHFFRSAESVVDASGGTPGVVTISSPELDLSGELTTLPASFPSGLSATPMKRISMTVPLTSTSTIAPFHAVAFS